MAAQLVAFADGENFNPRPPWGGRPGRDTALAGNHRNFNPRPPWGGRRGTDKMLEQMERISIHALRGEGDYYPPCDGNRYCISIHALRGEGDNS